MTTTYTEYYYENNTKTRINDFFIALDVLRLTPSEEFLSEDEDHIAWLESADPISYIREQTEKLK